MYIKTSLVAQTVKRLSAMRETWVWSLGWKDRLEKEKAIHSSTILPGKSHGQRSLVSYSPWGRKESNTTERLHLLYTTLCLSVHSLMDTWVCAAMNMGVKISVGDPAFSSSGYIPTSGIAVSCSTLFLIFWGTATWTTWEAYVDAEDKINGFQVKPHYTFLPFYLKDFTLWLVSLIFHIAIYEMGLKCILVAPDPSSQSFRRLCPLRVFPS